MGLLVATVLAALSGALYAAALPPSHAWPLALVSWVPLLVGLEGRRPREAALLGAIQGFVANAVALYWLSPVVTTFVGSRPIACALIACGVYLYDAGGVAVAGWIASRAAQSGWGRWLSFPIAVAAIEAFYPLVFPSFTGAQVHSVPVLMQLADIGGPILVGVPIVLANVAVAELVVSRLAGRRALRTAVVIGVLAPVFAALYGAIRIGQIDASVKAAPSLRVGIVQANTPHERMGLRAAIRTYRAATTAFDPKTDLVVWPETALSAVIQRAALEKTLDRQVLHTPEFPEPPPFPILSGAMLGRDTEISNSAVLFSPEGKLLGVYDKVHPLVFGEYVPLADRFPTLDTLIPKAGRLTAGARNQPTFELDGHRITPLICYEDVVPSFANDAVLRTHGELMVDLTNDSWFGSSTAAAMHLGVAKFRAIEHRRYLIHAATSGVSAFVDPVGRPLRETMQGETAHVVESVRWLQGESIYERSGAYPRLLLGLLVALMTLTAPRTFASRRRFAPSPPPDVKSGAGALDAIRGQFGGGSVCGGGGGQVTSGIGKPGRPSKYPWPYCVPQSQTARNSS
jgi:apolipoprotein N-acyltransferase